MKIVSREQSSDFYVDKNWGEGGRGEEMRSLPELTRISWDVQSPSSEVGNIISNYSFQELRSRQDEFNAE